MQHTFTMRPTPGLKGSYDILCDGQVIATGFGRADMKREFRAYQMGWKKVQFVSEGAAAVAVR